MEGGEVWKVEPTIVESARRGIRNVLRGLEMLEGEVERPDFQVVIEKTKWIRAKKGGFMQFHVAPGDIVEKGQPLATNTTLLGDERNSVHAPFDAVVIGMTSLPSISPGEPICHLGRLPKEFTPSDLRRLRSEEDGLEQRVSDDLASSVLVVDPAD
jgi:predicted deacylase